MTEPQLTKKELEFIDSRNYGKLRDIEQLKLDTYQEEKDKIEYDEQVADLFWKLNRTNRRKVLNKSAKWKAHVYKTLSKKNGSTREGTAD